MKFLPNNMKSFILKSAVVFIFSLLLFRFTIVSIANKYETKIIDLVSSSNFNQVKIDFFDHIKENNKKDNILDPNQAELLSIFLKKILKELDLKN